MASAPTTRVLPSADTKAAVVIPEMGSAWLIDLVSQAARSAEKVTFVVPKALQPTLEHVIFEVGGSKKFGIVRASSDRELDNLGLQPPHHVIVLPLKWDSKERERVRDSLEIAQPTKLWLYTDADTENIARRAVRIPQGAYDAQVPVAPPMRPALLPAVPKMSMA